MGRYARIITACVRLAILGPLHYMKFLVVAVGHKMPAWINAGFSDYVQRMPRASRIELTEIKPAMRSGTGEKSVRQWLTAEAGRIRAALPPRCFKVVLDECGKPCATRDFARRIERWKEQGQDIVFVIGGADGTAHASRSVAVAVAADVAAWPVPHPARGATIPGGFAAGRTSVS